MFQRFSSLAASLPIARSGEARRQEILSFLFFLGLIATTFLV